MSHTATLTVERPGIARRPSYAPRVTGGRVAWLPWSSSGAISTASREREFIAELTHRAGGVADESTRSDITAVLNALRGGLTIDQLFANAPGLRPERLYGAYERLEALRREASAAWSAIVADPGWATPMPGPIAKSAPTARSDRPRNPAGPARNNKAGAG